RPLRVGVVGADEVEAAPRLGAVGDDEGARIGQRLVEGDAEPLAGIAVSPRAAGDCDRADLELDRVGRGVAHPPWAGLPADGAAALDAPLVEADLHGDGVMLDLDDAVRRIARPRARQGKGALHGLGTLPEPTAKGKSRLTVQEL